MRSILTSLFVLIFFSNGLRGQWQIINEGIQYRLIDFVSGDVGWMVTHDEILKTTDGGESWNPDPWSLGKDFVDPETIREFDFINDSTGYFVQYKDINGPAIIYYTGNSGVTWVKILKKNYLNLAFVSEDLILSNHNNDTLLKSTDNGLSWEDITPSEFAWNVPSLASFFGTETGVIVAERSDGLIHRTVDGGVTWNEKIIPGAYLGEPPGKKEHILEIGFTDSLNGYLLLKKHDDGSHILYKTEDAFDTCTIVAHFPSSIRVHSVHFFNKEEGIALCENFNGPSGVIRTYDGGYTWGEIDPIGILGSRTGREFERSIEFLDDSSGFIFQKSPPNTPSCFDNFISLWKSKDKGASWTRQIFSYPFEDICFVNDKKGFVVGGEPRAGYNYGNILSTTDGGNSWNSSNGNFWSIENCNFISDSIGFASFIFGYEGSDYTTDSPVYQTKDGGENWNEYEHAFNMLTFFKFFNEDQAFAGNDSGFYVTNNGGETWDLLYFEAIEYHPTGILSSMVDCGENTFWAIGNNSSLVRFTSDGDWKSIEPEMPRDINEIFFKDQYTGWLFLESYYPETFYMFKTENGGESWLQVPTSCRFNDLLFRDSMTGWAVGRNQSGMGVILKTTNGGEDWVVQEDSLSAPLNAIDYKDGKVWAAGYNGLILTMDDSGEITSDKPVTPGEDHTDHFQLYPNPVHSVVLIETKIPEEYSIELFDLNGRLIRSEIRQGSRQQLDFSSIQPGIYTIRIRSVDQITTKKLIKQ